MRKAILLCTYDHKADIYNRGFKMVRNSLREFMGGRKPDILTIDHDSQNHNYRPEESSDTGQLIFRYVSTDHSATIWIPGANYQRTFHTAEQLNTIRQSAIRKRFV